MRAEAATGSRSDARRVDSRGSADPSPGRKGRNTEARGKRERGEHRRVYLFPGELLVTPDPCTVTTILGSCVAVCLWDPVVGCGGITHFVLPHSVDGRLASPRFGVTAIRLVLDGLADLGSRGQDLEAKVFGGASVQGVAPKEGRPSLGECNVTVARRSLADLGIPILAADVGGGVGRKIRFDTGDGVVWVKRL